MYIVFYLDQLCEYHVSLHQTREAAEAAIADLLQRFDIENTMAGESVHVFYVERDGGPAEELSRGELTAA
jgi:hypothetical protein